MNRIPKTLDQLRSNGKKALIPYITPEFPFRGITEQMLAEMVNAGADMIEVGIPFSDPLADGTTIQHSSDLALKNGANIPGILSSVRAFRKSYQDPILLMGYFNPILHFGIAKFVRECKEAGVDGLIVPDLPPEEASALQSVSAKHDLSNVFLIAPTTPDERMQKIDEASTDFSYCVSVSGVTGARQELGMNGSLDDFLGRVRANVRKPFVVGFGISTPKQVRKVWEYADGAVVGSALINAISNASSQNDALSQAGDFLRSLRN